LMSRLDGTDMQLNEIARQTDMRFDGIKNATRQTDMKLNEILRCLQEASSSQHQQHHGWKVMVTGALLTAYTVIALV